MVWGMEACQLRVLAAKDANHGNYTLLCRRLLIPPIRRHGLKQHVDQFLAIEAVGLSATSQQTLEVTRNKGTIIWIGNNQRIIEIDMQAIVTRELTVIGSYGMTDEEFQRSLRLLADGRIPTDRLINRRATLSEGPELFDQLLASPETIKCIINF